MGIWLENQSGIYIVVTADVKLRAGKSRLTALLSESKSGVVLGNAKDQTILMQ